MTCTRSAAAQVHWAHETGKFVVTPAWCAGIRLCCVHAVCNACSRKAKQGCVWQARVLLHSVGESSGVSLSCRDMTADPSNMGVWTATSVKWTATALACHALHCVFVHMEFSRYAMGHSDAAQRQPSAACQPASNASTAMCHGGHRVLRMPSSAEVCLGAI